MVVASVTHLPASKGKWNEYPKAQSDDPVCSTVINYCQKGWPEKSILSPDLIPYWKGRGNLTVAENSLLLYGKRIVVPVPLRRETLRRIHTGHQGIQWCILRANISVWWPGISREIEKIWLKIAPNVHETSSLESNLWYHQNYRTTSGKKIFLTLMEPHIIWWLITFPASQRLSDFHQQHQLLLWKLSSHVLAFQKLLWATMDLSILREFTEFAKDHNFRHITSSPHFPQSNGQAKRTVQTIKRLLRESDPHLSLLSYRSTPFPWCGLSPAELLMGRKLGANIPLLEVQLIPEWSYLKEFSDKNKAFKNKQKREYDRHYGVQKLSSIPPNSDIWDTSGDHPTPGTVIRISSRHTSVLHHTNISWISSSQPSTSQCCTPRQRIVGRKWTSVTKHHHDLI